MAGVFVHNRGSRAPTWRVRAAAGIRPGAPKVPECKGTGHTHKGGTAFASLPASELDTKLYT